MIFGKARPSEAIPSSAINETIGLRSGEYSASTA
jgi:hypothetical protein